jgi:hypothetical protein
MTMIMRIIMVIFMALPMVWDTGMMPICFSRKCPLVATSRGADDQAEAPIDQAGHDGSDGHQQSGAGARFGDACQPAQKSLCHRRGGQGIARHQDDAHLHGKGKEGPETLVPIQDHLKRAVFGEDDAKYEGEKGQQDGENHGIGHIFVCPPAKIVA